MAGWTRAALKNIGKILDYIAQDDEDAPRKVAKKIYDASKELDEHPQMGRKGIVSGTRELVIPKWPYILIYRCQEKSEVEILRVLHSKQK